MCFEIDSKITAPKAKKVWKVLGFTGMGYLASPYKNYRYDMGRTETLRQNARTSVRNDMAHEGLYVHCSFERAIAHAKHRSHWRKQCLVVVECVVAPEDFLVASVVRSDELPGRAATYRKITPVKYVTARGLKYLTPIDKQAIKELRKFKVAK